MGETLLEEMQEIVEARIQTEAKRFWPMKGWRNWEEEHYDSGSQTWASSSGDRYVAPEWTTQGDWEDQADCEWCAWGNQIGPKWEKQKPASSFEFMNDVEAEILRDFKAQRPGVAMSAFTMDAGAEGMSAFELGLRDSAIHFNNLRKDHPLKQRWRRVVPAAERHGTRPEILEMFAHWVQDDVRQCEIPRTEQKHSWNVRPGLATSSRLTLL